MKSKRHLSVDRSQRAKGPVHDSALADLLKKINGPSSSKDLPSSDRNGTFSGKSRRSRRKRPSLSGSKKNHKGKLTEVGMDSVRNKKEPQNLNNAEKEKEKERTNAVGRLIAEASGKTARSGKSGKSARNRKKTPTLPEGQKSPENKQQKKSIGEVNSQKKPRKLSLEARSEQNFNRREMASDTKKNASGRIPPNVRRLTISGEAASAGTKDSKQPKESLTSTKKMKSMKSSNKKRAMKSTKTAKEKKVPKEVPKSPGSTPRLSAQSPNKQKRGGLQLARTSNSKEKITSMLPEDVTMGLDEEITATGLSNERTTNRKAQGKSSRHRTHPKLSAEQIEVGFCVYFEKKFVRFHSVLYRR